VTSPAPRGLPLTFYSVAEPEPGPGWQGLFSSAWPAYRRWYLRDGAAARTHSDAYELGFGTLYTAVYRPAELAIEYRWPGSSWKHTIGSFADGQHEVVLGAS
jgi:hypothetical protein